MSVFRIEKNKNYTVMSNHHLRNKELSLKAKGLLSQMLSLPENWDYTLAGLSHINKESIDAIRTAVWELEKAGYIKRQQGRDEKGKMTAIEYIIYEQPQLENPILENPTTDKPILENPTSDEPKTENPTQINKDKTSTKELNTDLIKYPSINQTEQPVSTFATQTPPSASALLGGTRLIDRYNQNTELVKSNIEYATLVAGYNKWHDQFGRNVKKGEKGIKIIAPTPFKKKVEETKLDPDTKLPILDDNGKPVTEEKEVQIPMFRVVSVFDVSQTAGKPIPQLASDLSGNVQNYEAFMEAIKCSSAVPISFEPINNNTDGYFSLDEQKIVIREGMSEVQTVSALLHELAHSKLHNRKNEQVKDGEQTEESAKINRNTEEVQAESISFAVCAYYGIKTDENSFGYIASWSKDKELPELKDSLAVINKTSNEMINDIDKNYAEIRKERGLDNEVLDLDEAMFENSINYLHIQRTDDNAWDYSIYDKESLRLVDGGQIDNPDMKLEQVKEQIISEYAVKLPYGEPLPDSDKNRLLDDISEKALSQMSVDLPDPNITLADMKAYGYEYENMLPLEKEAARRLVEETDATVYMLYNDNTESMVLDLAEINDFDGIFGIEKQDWEAVKDNYLKNAEMSMEDDYDMIDGIVNNGDNKPTVAELEADIKDGKSISLIDLADAIEAESNEAKQSKPEKAAEEKPSLLAKLNRPLPPQQDKTQPKSKEREM